MEEHELVAPAEGLPTVRDGRNQHLLLTPPEKLLLTQWGTSQEYAVFLKLAWGEIERAETEHFKQWENEAKFRATGLVAVAMKIFLERLQTEINHQVEEFAGEVEFVRANNDAAKMSPEQLIQNSFGS